MCSKCDTGSGVTLPPRTSIAPGLNCSNVGRSAEFLGDTTHQIFDSQATSSVDTQAGEVELVKRKKPSTVSWQTFCLSLCILSPRIG